VVEPTGAETEMLVQIGDAQFVIVLHGRTEAKPGETVHLELDAASVHLFDAASGKRLN